MTIGSCPGIAQGRIWPGEKACRCRLKKNTGRELSAGLSGQRAVRMEMLSAIGPVPGVCAEIAQHKALAKGYRVLEVPVNMFHRESGRNLKGFMHRGKQFMIFFVLPSGR